MEFIENGFPELGPEPGPEPDNEYLRPTEFFDYDHAEVAAITDATVEGLFDDINDLLIVRNNHTKILRARDWFPTTLCKIARVVKLRAS